MGFTLISFTSWVKQRKPRGNRKNSGGGRFTALVAKSNPKTWSALAKTRCKTDRGTTRKRRGSSPPLFCLTEECAHVTFDVPIRLG